MNENEKIEEAKECAYFDLSYWKQSCFCCELFSVCNKLKEEQNQ